MGKADRWGTQMGGEDDGWGRQRDKKDGWEKQMDEKDGWMDGQTDRRTDGKDG